MWPQGSGACSTQSVLSPCPNIAHPYHYMEKIGVQPIASEDKKISLANVLKAIYENSYIFSFV